jgi:hypothetical protein
VSIQSFRESLTDLIGFEEPPAGDVRSVTHELVRYLSENARTREVQCHEMLLHPYGFLTIRLESRQELPVSDSLRLHIWPSSPLPTQVPHWPIHSHPWHLKSVIVCGSLTNITCRFVEQPAADYALYEAGRNGRDSVLSLGRRFGTARVVSHDRYRAGDAYTVPAGAFHASTPVSGRPTATIALVSGAVVDRGQVVGPRGGPPVMSFARQRPEPALLHPILRELENALTLPVNREASSAVDRNV